MSSERHRPGACVVGAMLLSLVGMLFCAAGAMGDLGGITAARDGDIWFTEPSSSQIGLITPNGAITQFPIPTAHSEPADLALGAEGDIWFTEYKANKIGRLDPSGAISEFPVPLPAAKEPEEGPIGLPSLPPPANAAKMIGPSGIALGSEGNLWFTESASSSSVSSIYGGEVGRITPAGVISEFPIPGRNSEPGAITWGPDGDLWFTERTFDGGVIGRVTPTGTIATFALPEGHELGAIATGPDGDLWFTDRVSGSQKIVGMIGRITPTGKIRDFSLPALKALPYAITLGADGDMWFTALPTNAIKQGPHGLSAGSTTGRIGRITPTGQVTEFATRHEVFEMTTSPDGDLWFTDGCLLAGCTASNQIGRITPAGKISEFSTKPTTTCAPHAPTGKTPRHPRRTRRRLTASSASQLQLPKASIPRQCKTER
jgi:virginiamycin B lyase